MAERGDRVVHTAEDPPHQVNRERHLDAELMEGSGNARSSVRCAHTCVSYSSGSWCVIELIGI